MDTNQYMGMFLEESREHLQTLNSCLLELEHSPEDPDVLNEIFRSAHTIKGMSATMGFTEIAELTHEMENVLDLLRKNQLKANEDIVDTIFKCVDTLEQMVENISSESANNIDVTELVAKLVAIAKGESIPTAPPQEEAKEKEPVVSEVVVELNDTETTIIKKAMESGLQVFDIKVSLSPNCLLKSARVYMVMNALDEIGDVLKSIPSSEDLEQENFESSFELIVATATEQARVQQLLSSISEITEVIVESLELPKSEAKAVVAEDNKKMQEASSAKRSQEKTKAPIAPSSSGSIDKKLKSGQSVRVDIEKLDSLLNLVGELVINKTRLEQIGITHRLTELVETIEQMDRVTTDLQSVVMKVRMVPVGQVFNRFPRMVRDLSRELNKEINLTIEGEETELDRTVIDEIGDPLVHLIRNSLDHGIEHPDERLAKGKEPTGEVRLIARHEGNNVIIMVEDDGKGINPEIIKSKAVEKGLITQEDADKMEDNEAVRLVFLAGFSTADVITDVSGRGVGMDVVKNKIESLGGLIDVETKLDEGSKFKIRLPLTLAIIQALLVKVQEEIYAIPLGSIDSTINITTDNIKTIQNREVILLRGQIIPIIRLNDVLHVPKVEESNDKDLFVVVVHMGDQKAGIIVDNLIGQQEIVIKTLGKLLAGIKVIAGATILGNGQVALILDVGTLMQ
ncbi:chemotaxis protein CheA [Anaerosinus gibii]|uniref:Chemotaxis protein CheA n=1 Tax=Selenobaculum gibii TaxID=3054208 RepID=A0A9Y2AKF9_9FIRM|nr:chemotaxis protein CheA [Selenobaculum gbiensis]WIW71602.1 chemotaxis protein CheA [Selenobaculum gbiensis]